MRRPHRNHRGGFALIDAIIGAVILGIGLAVVISLTSRAVQRQIDGEKRTTAAWLADGLLNMVLADGPVDYGKRNDSSGRFDAPFDEFTYNVELKDQGVNVPFRVTATVSWDKDRGGGSIQVQSLISERGGDSYQPRRPLEPVDRDAKYHPDDESP
ncbi:MAG TPA: hypothetical protein VG711_06320 [Phycisphaerales bacterium]|nr:hypothetical protein [Phycisphaerales bacterium]